MVAAFHQSWGDVLIVMVGSFIVLLLVYFSDLAYYCQQKTAYAWSGASVVTEKTRL
jgi:hypothetical protein